MTTFRFKIILVFLLVYGLGMFVFMPLSWLVPKLEAPLLDRGITIENPAGTLWKGQARIRVRGLGMANLHWTVLTSRVLLLKLPIVFNVENKDLSLDGMANASFDGLFINSLNGYVDESAVDDLYAPYGVTLSGRLRLNSVSASMGWDKSLGDIEGELTWSGGEITLPMLSQQGSFEVPMMVGQLDSNDAQWSLDVVNQTENLTYMTMSLQREGLGQLSIKRQLANDMALSIPGSNSVLFDISQQLF